MRRLVYRLLNALHDRWCPCEAEWQDYLDMAALEQELGFRDVG